MSVVSLFPQIPDKVLETVIVSCKRFYHYIGGDGNQYAVEETQIKGFEDKSVFELEDDNCEYDQSTDSLFLDIKLNIKNGKYLFGKFGYAVDDSIIGVGLEWKSKKSKIRHYKYLGAFSKTNTANEVILEVKDIILNELNSDTSFNWVMFIKKSGKDIPGAYIANKEGLIICRKTLWTIKGEGDGSLFPIIEAPSIGEPLWKVKTDFDNAFIDSFTIDNVCILINKSHKDYQYLQNINRYYNQSFLKEVLSSSLFMLIKEIASNIDDFKNIKSKHCENGSIVQALLFFEQELGMKIHDDDISLLRSIKLYFDKNMF